MTTTAATSTTSSASSSGSQILTALGSGSGIDTSSLISSLVSASFDPKTAAVTAKQTANTAKISELATLSNGIDTFSSALATLISGGTLATQPTSSDSAVLTATAKPGALIGGLSAQLSVRQVAQAQSLVSGYFTNAATPVGAGTLIIGTAGGSATLTIDSSSNSLAGIARAINASGTGLAASIVTDANGARLSIKGPTGSDSAFTLSTGPNSDAGLAALTYGAQPQMSVSGSEALSPVFADATSAPVGQGSFTLAGPNGSATVSIGAGNDTLDGLAAAINASGTGLSANVVTDPEGVRLAISDGSGNPPSFTLTPAAGAQTGLSRFTYPAPTTAGMTLAQSAADAIIRMDGIDVVRGTNEIDDLIDGVTLKLVAAAPGETISLAATRPTDALKQAVGDFVAAYNEMKSEITKATAATVTNDDGTTTTGPLYGNAAIRQMQTQLSRLTSTILNTSGGPQTLADIGVSTNRDGTLSLDDTALTKALTNYPDAVEAMFNPTQHASSPLIKITSAMGVVKPGTYTLTSIVAGTDSVAGSGLIDGVPMITTGNQLYASVSTAASGLVIEPQGDVASATITVDPGLGGALTAIRDALRASGGLLDALSSSLTSEQTDLADQQTKITDDEATYRARLVTQFSTMDTRVSQINAIKSYLTQQIAVWTKDTNS